ncbi:MAG: hypothetical protein AVDCRST_MAG08-2016, partial [uncultured Acetobacteraceae bacterium]
ADVNPPLRAERRVHGRTGPPGFRCLAAARAEPAARRRVTRACSRQAAADHRGRQQAAGL